MPLEWRFLHQRDLLTKREHVFLPIAMRIEPWEGEFKCGILPAAGNPRGIMHDSQTSQSFDQVEFARIENSKLLVSGEKCVELRCLFILIAR